MESGDITRISFQDVPLFVRFLLGRSYRDVLGLGFRELVVYTRGRMPAPNYSAILVSPDNETVVEIEYARIAMLETMLIILVRPRDFLRCVIGVHGTCFTSVFADLKRCITTKHAFLAANAIPGEKEFLIVPRASSVETIYEQHRQHKGEFAAKYGLVATQFRDAADFLAFDHAALKKLAGKLRQESSLPEVRS